MKLRYFVDIEAETEGEADKKLDKKLTSAFETTQTFVDCFDVVDMEGSEGEGDITDAENN
jgi:hypothetical protein